METNEVIDYCLKMLTKRGANEAVCRLSQNEITELSFNQGKITMLRTTFDTTLTLTAYIDQKKGMQSINQLDKESLDLAIKDTIELANASEIDPANMISELQPAETFEFGTMDADMDTMCDRLSEFLSELIEKYPTIRIEEGGVSFMKSKHNYKNSNGVDFSSVSGSYDFSPMFTAKDGEKSASFNYCDIVKDKLDQKLIEMASLRSLIEQNIEQVNAEPFTDKFVGDIIITPDCFGDFMNTVISHLRDYAHIADTSLYKGKLNQQIANKQLTLRSICDDKDMVRKCYFTNDGFKAENLTVIKNGVLKSNLLSNYGARKTGQKRAKNYGQALLVEPGSAKFEDMVRSIDKGLLLCRFSGAYPNDNGDFSGVAKNSYYIEDGEIVKPVNEIMINGNIAEMLNNITDISKEKINFGHSSYPWVKVKKITISGK